MPIFITKLMIAASIIAFSSWLAGKRPELAGFLVALPLTTMLALFFTYAEYQDTQASVQFAKSIFIGIPVSLLFFIPFLMAERLQLSFWQCYAAGTALLVGGYFIHKVVISYLH